MKIVSRAWMLLLVCGLAGLPAQAEEITMKFNEVKELAPGVFFRYSSISPTDMSIFGGSNNIWVVFEDYVVVIDANFPKEAKDVIAAIKKTTDKPIRYVFDTHHHGDHAYGNAIFAKEGASVISQANCSRIMRASGAQEFKDAGKGPTGRKDIAESYLKVPDVIFDDKFVLDDGKQRIEFLFFGHSHTAGDASAYLPKQKILCTGDACLNGAFNYMGQGDSASWIRCLEKMQQLDVKTVCPGHGLPMGKELIENQKRYFTELREQVKKGIDANKDLEDIIKGIDMPWYKEWTSVPPPGDNIKHVYAELTGRTMPWDLVEDFGIYEGPSPTKDDKGWTKPRRIVVQNLMPSRLNELKRVAPDIEFIPVKTGEEAAKVVEDADAVLGFCTPEIVRAGKNLRWIQLGHAGVEKELSPELVGSKIVLTNTKRLYGPPVADTAFALLLGLTRNLRVALPQQLEGVWKLPDRESLQELHGKTMLVIGLGGIGTNVSKRAQAFGMRVMAIDPGEMERPSFVFSIDKPAKLMELLPKADVVVISCPLTSETKGMIGENQLGKMKKSAYLINVGRGGIVKTSDLIAALDKKQIAGAGMDVVDPEPLPADSPLWKMPNVVIFPHTGAQAAGAVDRAWRLLRENLRRYVAGEALLCVVDKEKGF